MISECNSPVLSLRLVQKVPTVCQRAISSLVSRMDIFPCSSMEKKHGKSTKTKFSMDQGT